MDNDDAIVGRIFTRREAILSAAKAGLGVAFTGFGAAFAQKSTATEEVHLVASPALTEGPFFVDEKLNRSNLLAGTDRPSVVKGVPLELKFKIYRLQGNKYVPLKGAQVDVWHADAHGVYSDEAHPMNHENTAGQRWLRGYQITDADGLVVFQTIFPGWYPSRTAHIHFKVRNVSSTNQTAEFTSQLFFEDAFADKVYAREPYASQGRRDTTNGNDNIFGERQVDGSKAGAHLLLAPTAKGEGFTSAFNVALTDDNTKPARRRGPGGPPPGWGWGG